MSRPSSRMDRETDRLAPATTLDAFLAAPLTGKLSLILRRRET